MNLIASPNSICKVLLFFGLFFLFQSAHSQLFIGPRAGTQLTWVNFDDKRDKDFYKVKPVIDYHAGFTLAAQVRKRFYLQADFLYIRKGRSYKGKQDDILKYDLINHYFEIPLIYRMDFKTQLSKNEGFKWYIGLGPNISYWWKGNGTLKSSELLEANVQETEFEVRFDDPLPDESEKYALLVEEPNRIQLGLNIATGVVFEPPAGNVIVIDFRFELGHSFMARKSPARFGNSTSEFSDFTDPMNTRNMGAKMSVAYLFDTKISQRKRGKTKSKVK